MVAACVNAAHAAVNKDLNYEQRLFVQQIESTTFESWKRHVDNPTGDHGSEGLDCCIAHIFGWGKTSTQQAVRTAYAAKMLDGSLHPTESIFNAPKDFQIAVSERFKYYGGLMCFLGKQDFQSHRILMVTLRQPMHKTFRFRSQESEQKREDKKRLYEERKREARKKATSSKPPAPRSPTPTRDWQAQTWSRPASPARQWRPQTWSTWNAWTWTAAYGWTQGQGHSVDPDWCNAYAFSHAKEPTDEIMPLLLLMALAFFTGCFLTWFLCFRGRRKVSTVPLMRSIAVQSQTTYTGLRGVTTPRFLPLNEQSHGVFIG